jgi:hypothetical protein
MLVAPQTEECSWKARPRRGLALVWRSIAGTKMGCQRSSKQLNPELNARKGQTYICSPPWEWWKWARVTSPNNTRGKTIKNKQRKRKLHVNKVRRG